MPSPELVDWPLAARVGRSFAGTGPATTPAQRAQARADFRELTPLSDELVRSFTGLTPDGPAPSPTVLDRGGWIRANLDGFKFLVQPIAEKVATSVPLAGVARRVTAAALGVQVGLLLGYLSQKVLGQYDLVLATEGAGKVYFVGPNVIEAEQRWDLDRRDFRLWITLHEVTHRTQFTGVPWLRDRVRGLIHRSVEALELDPARIGHIVARGKELLKQGPSGWKSANIMSLLMSEPQRALIDEMQALMTAVEGHGTFVMNRIGADRIPTYARMKEVLESRRGASGPERVLQRAIGMDMKYDQYALGERFCNGVAERAGVGCVNLMWEREENLPSLDEMRAPEGWLARVLR